MGNWKSIDELEESITLKELQLLMDARNKEVDRQQRFQAAIQGIELPEDEPESKEEGTWEQAQAKAQAILAGKSEEEMFFDDLGVDFESI